MKFVITESKLNQVIHNYLNRNFIPDIGWGPEIFEFVENEIEESDFYAFTVDDFIFAVYWGESQPNTLKMNKIFADRLTDLFGDRWIPIFINWFEKGTGLKVKDFVTNMTYR